MGSNTVEQEYRVARKETDSRRLESMHCCPIRHLYDNAVVLGEYVEELDGVDGEADDAMESILSALDYTNERKMVIDVRDYDSLVKYIEYLQHRLHGKQARIDELMMEFTPEDVTEEQFEEWAKWQVVWKGPPLGDLTGVIEEE